MLFAGRGSAMSLCTSKLTITCPAPVTGSLQASAAQWLIDAGELPDRYVAAQGTRIGRAGRVHLERADGEVWVGGGTHTVVDGTIDL